MYARNKRAIFGKGEEVRFLAPLHRDLHFLISLTPALTGSGRDTKRDSQQLAGDHDAAARPEPPRSA